MNEATLTRIRKLLAQAEGESAEGNTEAAELFNEKASELIAKYGIDEALLAASGEKTAEIGQVKIPIDSPYSRDKADLLTNIAFALRCRVVLHQRGRSVHSVTVFGFMPDVERVQLLYTSLLMQVGSQLVRVRPDLHDVWQSTAAYRRMWMHGFALAVYRRLCAAEKKAVDTSEPSGDVSTALVVQDREKQVEKAYEEAFTNLRKATRRKLSGTGYEDGRHAGDKADLHNTGIAGQKGLIGRGG